MSHVMLSFITYVVSCYNMLYNMCHVMLSNITCVILCYITRVMLYYNIVMSCYITYGRVML